MGDLQVLDDDHQHQHLEAVIDQVYAGGDHDDDDVEVHPAEVGSQPAAPVKAIGVADVGVESRPGEVQPAAHLARPGSPVATSGGVATVQLGAPGRRSTYRAYLLARNPPRSLENDLVPIPDITKASVGLFGAYPDIELRAVLAVRDNADLDQPPDRVEEVLARLHTTAGIALDPIQIALRFSEGNRERQLL